MTTFLSDPAALVVHARLLEQVEEIRRRSTDVRQGLPEGIHQLRVALRRLRSALATYRPFLERGALESLNAELKWLGTMLAAARDAEVQAARLGSLSPAIGLELEERQQLAHTQAVAALDSARYAALRARLDRLSAQPPWTPAADRPIGDVLPQQVHRAWNRLAPRVEAAHRSADEVTRAEHLHDVRKAAKRARYAAEPLVDLHRPCGRTVSRAKRIQLVLGEHQDTVAARALLLEIGARLPAAEATILKTAHDDEQAKAAALESTFFELWDELT